MIFTSLPFTALTIVLQLPTAYTTVVP